MNPIANLPATQNLKQLQQQQGYNRQYFGGDEVDQFTLSQEAEEAAAEEQKKKKIWAYAAGIGAAIVAGFALALGLRATGHATCLKLGNNENSLTGMTKLSKKGAGDEVKKGATLAESAMKKTLFNGSWNGIGTCITGSASQYSNIAFVGKKENYDALVEKITDNGVKDKLCHIPYETLEKLKNNSMFKNYLNSEKAAIIVDTDLRNAEGGSVYEKIKELWENDGSTSGDTKAEDTEKTDSATTGKTETTDAKKAIEDAKAKAESSLEQVGELLKHADESLKQANELLKEANIADAKEAKEAVDKAKEAVEAAKKAKTEAEAKELKTKEDAEAKAKAAEEAEAKAKAAEEAANKAKEAAEKLKADAAEKAAAEKAAAEKAAALNQALKTEGNTLFEKGQAIILKDGTVTFEDNAVETQKSKFKITTTTKPDGVTIDESKITVDSPMLIVNNGKKYIAQKVDEKVQYSELTEISLTKTATDGQQNLPVGNTASGNAGVQQTVTDDDPSNQKSSLPTTKDDQTAANEAGVSENPTKPTSIQTAEVIETAGGNETNLNEPTASTKTGNGEKQVEGENQKDESSEISKNDTGNVVPPPTLEQISDIKQLAKGKYVVCKNGEHSPVQKNENVIIFNGSEYTYTPIDKTKIPISDIDSLVTENNRLIAMDTEGKIYGAMYTGSKKNRTRKFFELTLQQ